MKINEHGYWENETDEGHGHDEKLGKAIVDFLKKEYYNNVPNYTSYMGLTSLTVADLGCGTGYYTHLINEVDILMAHGYDGNPNTYELAGLNTIIFDLSTSCFFIQSYDWALSLEVGEHIPVEYEQIFLDNVARVGTGVILSWAIPGQGGDGHVNCRDNDYIIHEMELRNFYLDRLDTRYLRDSCSPYPETGWWFKNTIMVFRRK